MTAFGRAGDDLVDWEIRSVNHRYLEISLRLPEPFRDLEQALRDVAASRLRRGKVDATLRLARQATIVPRLNDDAFAEVLGVVDDARRRLGQSGTVDAVELLRWPGVMQDDPDNVARFKEAARTRFAAAVDDLLAHRNSEGAQLDALLRERLADVERVAAAVRELVSDQAEAIRDRLHKRVQELGARVEIDRLEQEVALLAQKSDVFEELDRLDIHVAEARRSLDGEEPCGRRLDFLTQEMNREANTLAAKSVLPDAARLAVDLKVLIDQMREQAQNIE